MNRLFPVLCFVAIFLLQSGYATEIRFSVSAPQFNAGSSIIADTDNGPVELQMTSAGAYSFSSNPRALQEVNTFTITNIEVTCNTVASECYSGLQFDLNTRESPAFPLHDKTHIVIDGSSNASNAMIYLSYSTDNGSQTVTNSPGWLTVALTGGAFYSEWWLSPVASPDEIGGANREVTNIVLRMDIVGLQRGEWVSMPGSLSVSSVPPASPVPEPTSLILLGSGIGVLGLAAWRKRK